MVRQGCSTTRLRATLLALATTLAVALLSAPLAHAAEPPPGSEWSQAYFKTPDGTQLHADVLRPKGAGDRKTPVILSIGPYFNHSGQVGALGPVQGAPYDPVTATGPSDRFYDFINGAKVFERGYTWVQVDLRGFGASNGCLDWSGPGEQQDVKTAVEWAASQPWSTGKVGMYGKSYDGVTGIMGIVQQPKGLAAVVAQEPVYDMYRYLYTNRVRYPNSLLTPNLYNAIAATPGAAADGLNYNFEALNDTARPGCPVLNFLDQQDPNHDSAYWKARDFVTLTKGKKTPFFLTQGFLENNTKPDGAFELYNGLAGPKRAWLGMWDHVRGNDADETGRLAMGRAGWYDEVIRFFDRYVAGKSAAAAPTEKDPPIALQTSDGKWRSEGTFPTPDSFLLDTPLKAGSYQDTGVNNGTGEAGEPYGDGIWTFSPPLDTETHLSGIPSITLDVATQAPNANLVANVYDVDPQRRATLISRNAYLLPGSGKVSFDLYGNDWKLPAGHRIGVLVTSSNAEWWAHAPTLQSVTVKSATIRLPYLSCARTQTIQGASALKLDDYRENAPFEVPAETITAGESASFPLPAPLTQGCSKEELEGGAANVPASQGGGGGGSQGTPAGCVDRRKFAFRIHQPKRDRIVKAVAYVNGKRKASKKARRGKRVTRISIARLPQRTFTVRIVATSAKGKRTISVRRYKGCKKGRPSTTVRNPR